MKRTLVRSSSPVALPLLALALIGVACSDRNPLQASVATSEANGEIIGGFAANDARLDAVGSLVLKFPTVPGVPPRPPALLCSASLIAPETVLTAKHCTEVIPRALQRGLTLAFALGPDSARPRAMVDVVAFENAPLDEGGFVDEGSDVAVVHLERALPNEPTVTLGTLSTEDVGKPFVAIGYGAQDNSRRDGTRRIGRETLRALEGKFFEIVFGSFEAFFEWVQGERAITEAAFADPPPPVGDAGPPVGDGGASADGRPTPPSLEELARRVYETTVLLKGYEALTGGRPGDSQTCYGDSGSPLIRRVDGRSVAYGVVSGGIESKELICDHGTVYATFGPTTLPFLQKAMTWTDPCGDINSAGSCDGTVARRCTTPLEGPRRVVEFDCGLVELACGMIAGQVACGDEALAPPPTAQTALGTEPDARALRALLERKRRESLLRRFR